MFDREIRAQHPQRIDDHVAVAAGVVALEAEQARRVRELAAFYGIQSQRLAAQLGFELQAPRMGANELG